MIIQTNASIFSDFLGFILYFLLKYLIIIHPKALCR